MANAVVENLALRIVDRLKTIAVGDTYNNTVNRVLRPTRTDWSVGMGIDHLDIILEQGERTREDELSDGSPAAIAWLQSFILYGFVVLSDNESTPVDQVVNDFAADIEKALTIDVQWPDGDGDDHLAIDSRITSVSPILDPAGEYSGCIVTYDCLIRTQENDPRVNRVG